MIDPTGWAPSRRNANVPAGSDEPDGDLWDLLDPWIITHPDHPVVGDDSAAVIEEAIVELTLRRTPMALGDGLAELHAMVSLLAQLQAWLPVAVTGARRQSYSWDDIAAQLKVAPSTARRRHHADVTGPEPEPIDSRPEATRNQNRTDRSHLNEMERQRPRGTQAYPTSDGA